jgi:vacuolar-type H+-ATPase subunit I/STV1
MLFSNYAEKNYDLNIYRNSNKNIKLISDLIMIEIISTILLMMIIGIPTVYFAQKPDNSTKIISKMSESYELEKDTNEVCKLISTEQNKLFELVELVKTYNKNLEQIIATQKKHTTTLNKKLSSMEKTITVNDIIENVGEITKNINLTKNDRINIKRNVIEAFNN